MEGCFIHPGSHCTVWICFVGGGGAGGGWVRWGEGGLVLYSTSMPCLLCVAHKVRTGVLVPEIFLIFFLFGGGDHTIRPVRDSFSTSGSALLNT